MIDDLRRIARGGQHEIEIRKSRFICTIERVVTEEAARDVIARLKKEHWQANHNCSAYILGPRGEAQRSSDDGEPSGTAGMPMLEVLRRQRLTDIVAVVTRYFGGTLLGAGGLIRAYGGAVSATLGTLQIVERRILQVVAVEVPHAEAGRLLNALIASPFPDASVDYGATGAQFELHLAREDVDPFRRWLAEQTSGSAEAVVLGEMPIDVPVATNSTLDEED